MGGATSLKVPGQNAAAVLTAPGFLPASLLPIAHACSAQFECCVAETRADWSYLCPPAMLSSDERTGRYRLGSDSLLVDEKGESHISIEDFAVALIDEAENRKHTKARFSAAY